MRQITAEDIAAQMASGQVLAGEVTQQLIDKPTLADEVSQQLQLRLDNARIALENLNQELLAAELAQQQNPDNQEYNQQKLSLTKQARDRVEGIEQMLHWHELFQQLKTAEKFANPAWATNLMQAFLQNKSERIPANTNGLAIQRDPASPVVQAYNKIFPASPHVQQQRQNHNLGSTYEAIDHFYTAAEACLTGATASPAGFLSLLLSAMLPKPDNKKIENQERHIVPRPKPAHFFDGKG